MACNHRLFLAAFAFLTTLSAARADDVVEAVASVKQLQDGQLGIIQKIGQMSVKQRFDALRPAIGATFDLQEMSRSVYGAGWDALTAAQKAEWSAAFGDFIAAGYAIHLDGFNGTGFERDEKTVARDGGQIVTSRVILAKGPPMALNYVVRRTPDGWKIEDILDEGSVSELAQWRRALRGLAQGGFASSVATLRQRTEAMLTP